MKAKKIILLLMLTLIVGLIVTTIALGVHSLHESDVTIARIDAKIGGLPE